MRLVNFPVILAVFTLLILWFSGRLGVRIRDRRKSVDERSDQDFGIALTATLTLLGLIIGFSFSMAVGRYEQRKNYEAEEANAVGTEYLRAGVLPAGDAAKVRSMLTRYVDERILFYESRGWSGLEKINADTGQLQDQLWAAVEAPAEAKPTALSGLALSGMNDVLNSQGYTQAAWLYRIPIEAWVLMLAIAIYANLLMGYGSQNSRPPTRLLMVLPILVSISFLLVADIDSPRGGLVRVHPENLIALSHSLHGR
jgi:hypothetical protein